MQGDGCFWWPVLGRDGVHRRWLKVISARLTCKVHDGFTLNKSLAHETTPFGVLSPQFGLHLDDITP